MPASCFYLTAHTVSCTTQWRDTSLSLFSSPSICSWAAFDFDDCDEVSNVCISVLYSLNVSAFFSSISHLNWSSARSRLNTYTHAYTQINCNYRFWIHWKWGYTSCDRSIVHPEITEQFPQKTIINLKCIHGVDNVRCWFYAHHTLHLVSIHEHV